jgi:predicted phage terminase large subunit-like protein
VSAATPPLKDDPRALAKAGRDELLDIYQHYRSVSNELLRRAIIEHNRIDLLATEILGYEVHPFHLKMLQFQFQHPQSLQLAYRGAGKSTLLTVTKTIHYLLKDPNFRILIASKTGPNARKFLREIKNHFESNERLIEVFGVQYDPHKVAKWDETEIEILPRTSTDKQPSVMCCGAVDSTVASLHVDAILSDDLVDEDNSRTKLMRDKMTSWFYQSLDPCLEPPDIDIPHRGEHHIVGTRYHYDDQYGRMMEKEMTDHHHIVPAEDEDGNTPWPERHSPEWLAEKKAKSGVIIYRCQYLCHSEDTEFLTEEGWRRWDRVGGERLAAFDIETRRLEFQHPTDRIRYRYSGNLLHIKNLKVDALVTPDHQMVVQPADYPAPESWQKVAASRLIDKRSGRTGRVILYSGAKWIGSKTDTFRIPAGARMHKYGLSAWKDYSQKYHGEREVSMDLFVQFLGYFISEGSTGRQSRGGIRLSQNEGPVLDSMRQVLRSMGFSFRESMTGKTVMLDFRHIGLWRWLRMEVKTYSNDARIPRKFFDLSQHQLMILFEALIAGDGWIQRLVKSDAYQYSTTSEQLADDIAELAVRLGLDSSIRRYPARQMTIRGKNYMQAHDSWRVCLRKAIGNGIDPLTQIREVPYNGHVVCFSVPFGTLITRRAGKVLYSGNCDAEAMKGEVFHFDDCQQIEDSQIPDGLKIFQGNDLAVSEEAKRDNAQYANVTIGEDKAGNIYVIDYYLGHISFPKQIELGIKMYEEHDPIRAGVESNAYQKAFYQQVKHLDKDYRFVPIHTDKDKMTRALKLTPMFEAKRVFFRKNMQPLIDQFVLFPGYRYRDGLDAFDMADRARRMRRRKQKARKTEPGLI